MKALFFHTSLFFSLAAFSQLDMPSDTGKITANSFVALDIIGTIYKNQGYCSTAYQLDSNMTYQKSFGCCKGKSVVEKGNWQMINGNMLRLESGKNVLDLDIHQYCSYLYFVPLAEKDEYEKIIAKEKKSLKNGKRINEIKKLSALMLSRRYSTMALRFPNCKL